LVVAHPLLFFASPPPDFLIAHTSCVTPHCPHNPLHKGTCNQTSFSHLEQAHLHSYALCMISMDTNSTFVTVATAFSFIIYCCINGASGHELEQ
jgi:hypothetical protein